MNLEIPDLLAIMQAHARFVGHTEAMLTFATICDGIVIVHPNHVAKLKLRFPNVKLTTLDGAGRTVALTRPIFFDHQVLEEIFSKLRDWIYERDCGAANLRQALKVKDQELTELREKLERIKTRRTRVRNKKKNRVKSRKAKR